MDDVRESGASQQRLHLLAACRVAAGHYDLGCAAGQKLPHATAPGATQQPDFSRWLQGSQPQGHKAAHSSKAPSDEHPHRASMAFCKVTLV